MFLLILIPHMFILHFLLRIHRIHKHQLRIPFLIQSLQHRVHHLKRLDPFQKRCRMLHQSLNLFSRQSLKLLRFCLEIGSQQIQILWNSQKAQEFQDASKQLWDSSMQTNPESFNKILNFLLNSQEFFG